MEGCLGESFLLAMDFLRVDGVGSEGGSAGATPLHLLMGSQEGPIPQE